MPGVRPRFGLKSWEHLYYTKYAFCNTFIFVCKVLKHYVLPPCRTDTIAIIFVYVRVARDLSLEIRVREKEHAETRYIASDELACSIIKSSVLRYSPSNDYLDGCPATVCPAICHEVFALQLPRA